MPTSLFGSIIVMLILLVVVIVFFAVLDRLLKDKTSKKNTKENPTPKTKPVEQPTVTAPINPATEPAAETVTPATMQIYNSELADDLYEMLKNSDTNKSSRLQIENHMGKESNITKYLQSKNYQSFDFAKYDSGDSENHEEPLSMTPEDYKRIVALSNIDDHKPL